MKRFFILALIGIVCLLGYAAVDHSDLPMNVDRINLGKHNYGANLNPTKDITLSDSLYIDGTKPDTIDIGAPVVAVTAISISKIGQFALHTVAGGDTMLGGIYLSSADSILYVGGRKADNSGDSLHVLHDINP